MRTVEHQHFPKVQALAGVRVYTHVCACMCVCVCVHVLHHSRAVLHHNYIAKEKKKTVQVTFTLMLICLNNVTYH